MVESTGQRKQGPLGELALAVLVALATTGCVTVAEFRALERDVRALGGEGGPTGSRAQVADLTVQLDRIEEQLAQLQGRVEVAEHRVDEALDEARRAREAAGRTAAARPTGPAEPPPAAADAELAPADAALVRTGEATREEVQAYRAAYAAWRGDDTAACIDQFRSFLQTNGSSPFADDAAFWMADCYFKQGDFKTAILRFDDVVSRYPGGNKAADALYRQGEALLRLGPGYAKAAGKAFERVIREYPESARAAAARRQLEILGSG